MTHLLEIFHASPELTERLEAFWVAKAKAWAKTAHNNRIPAHEASRAQVGRAVAVLWYEFYTEDLSTDDRNYIAYDFTKRWIDAPHLRKVVVIHPATRKKEKTMDLLYVPITDVLGDFVIRAMQEDEKYAEYPVSNPDRVIRKDRDRRAAEVFLLSQTDADATLDEGGAIPNGWVSEIKLIKDELTPVSEPTVDKYQAELRRVKKYAGFYAATYAEERGCNEAETLKRIRKLDLSRVAECLICANAFYRHDMRQVYCDCQQNEDRRLSTCQRIGAEMVELERKKAI